MKDKISRKSRNNSKPSSPKRRSGRKIWCLLIDNDEKNNKLSIYNLKWTIKFSELCSSVSITEQKT